MFAWIKDQLKALWRGEVRVKGMGKTGRVYKSLNPFRAKRKSPGMSSIKGKPKLTVSARVFRKETGKWEEVGELKR